MSVAVVLWDVVADSRSASKLSFDNPLESSTQVFHASIHAIGERFEGSIRAQARVGVDCDTKLAPGSFELLVEGFDLIARGTAFDSLDEQARELIQRHGMANQVVLRRGALDSIGDVFGTMLNRASFPDGTDPWVSGPGDIE